ncbi:LysR family transcriptional regulator, cyn operon transcriptional activator [Paraburkholderia steynii]|uniref:LysR family transcriptional regulator, cyn operon transcriptional activator n=1 Tax=Paraburkholderia steynii TaxID=1245441 RepID=A0A7Z7FIF9_9BURK|nr:transcriptional regulator CynR [Paraburkholderia steynii]SDI20898.1 LysR family transcriptional regulator, cyn operon transcriptional activator [Paraburkholderia steynii]
MLLRHIRYFLAVAEHHNFTRAAEALHVSQPTLSQQIRQLEDTLRTQLLDRSGRTVQLTDAGMAWMRYAKLALQDLDAGVRAIHDVGELSRGNLRLAVTPTFTAYLVGPVIDRFYASHPGIAIEIQEMTQDQIEAQLADDKLDAGIAFEPVYAAEIESQPLFQETLSLVVGGGHARASRRKALSAQDFAKEPLVLLNKAFATRRYIDEYCARHRVRPQVAIEVNSISAIVEIVRHGQLATVLPDGIAREHAELRPVPLDPPLPARTAALLQRKDAYRTAASKAFVQVLMESLKR